LQLSADAAKSRRGSFDTRLDQSSFTHIESSSCMEISNAAAKPLA
jgi:hypothetical protein